MITKRDRPCNRSPAICCRWLYFPPPVSAACRRDCIAEATSNQRCSEAWPHSTTLHTPTTPTNLDEILEIASKHENTGSPWYSPPYCQLSVAPRPTLVSCPERNGGGQGELLTFSGCAMTCQRVLLAFDMFVEGSLHLDYIDRWYYSSPMASLVLTDSSQPSAVSFELSVSTKEAMGLLYISVSDASYPYVRIKGEG
uniref:Uncharacterized protein n=1 Tax=Timema genevievae TaxID=629358 RepID=A0A7R9JXA7_TIMGE|nr:unnamed protein product [Timema genevievae]